MATVAGPDAQPVGLRGEDQFGTPDVAPGRFSPIQPGWCSRPWQTGASPVQASFSSSDACAGDGECPAGIQRVAIGRFPAGRPGKPDSMIFWSKRSGRPGKVRFLWWPLILSLALSIGVTLLLNMGR